MSIIKKKDCLIVFGASSGIGNYLYKRFSKKIKVFGATSSNIKKNYFKYKSEKSIIKIFSDIKKNYNCRMIIVCNGSSGKVGRIDKVSMKNFINNFDTNFFSVVKIIKNYIRFFDKKKIIVFSGGGAFNAFPRFDSYACSKAALVRFVENIASEYKNEVQINAIAPGFLFTKIQKELIKNNEKKDIGEKYFKFLIKNKNKNNKFIKIFRLVNLILNNNNFKINGKTISVNFDPWNSKKFLKKVSAINKSDYMLLRRVNNFKF
jgi:short-subunit dehydrogenase